MEDFLRGAFGGDCDQQVTSTIEVSKRGGTGFVGLHADADGLGPIVFALIELAAAMVADAGNFRRPCFDVENGFAIGAGAASAQPSHNLLEGKFVAKDAIELKAVLKQEFFEGPGLGNRAGETVQEEATFAAEATDAFGNQGQHCAVGNQFAAAHKLERRGQRGSQFARSGLFRSAKDVAGGQVASAHMVSEELGLSPFADARGAQQNKAPRVLLRFRGDIAPGVSPFEPGFPIAHGYHGFSPDENSKPGACHAPDMQTTGNTRCGTPRANWGKGGSQPFGRPHRNWRFMALF